MEREEGHKDISELVLYQLLVEASDDSMYLIDREYRYLLMNEKHRFRLGVTGHEYKGAAYGRYHSLRETNQFREKVDRVFKTGVSVRHEHKSQRDRRYFLRTISPVRDRNGTITAVTVISKDISDRKEMEEKLHTLSITDELTGLFNHRGFHALAEQQLKLAKRYKKKIYLLYADLDDLKGINDTFGHGEGDAALSAVAAILKECFRNSDVVARIGGDEFTVLPIGAVGEHIGSITERLMKRIDSYNEKTEHPYRLSLSAGIASFDPALPCSVDELLHQADESMYEFKRNKRK